MLYRRKLLMEGGFGGCCEGCHVLVSKRVIKSYLSKIRKLIEEGKLSKSDFVKWLRGKGIKASTRTPWDTLLERIYEARLEVEELDRFLSRYSKVRRVVKRKIEEVIAEEAEKRKLCERRPVKLELLGKKQSLLDLPA